MKENLSAQGNIDDFINSSEEALWNAGFESIELDDRFNRLSAYYGSSGYISIDFIIQNDGRVRFEIETSDQKLLDLYKYHVTEVITNPSYSESSQDNDPHEDLDDDEYYRSSSRRSRKSKRKHNKSFGHMPKGSHLRKKRALFGRAGFIFLMLVLIPPFGIFLMFYFKRFRIFPRFLIALITVLYMLLIWLSFFGVDTGVNKESIHTWMNSVQSQVTRIIESTKAKPTTNKTDPTPTTSTESPTPTTDDITDDTTPPTTDSTDNVIQNIIDKILPSTDNK